MNGRWLPAFIPDPSSHILAVHAALVRTSSAPEAGSIVFFSGNDYSRAEHDAGRVDRTRIYDCEDKTVTVVPSPRPGQGQQEPPDLFCCGHAMLGDGRLLVIGGTHIFGLSDASDGGFHHGHWPGLDTTFIFDPMVPGWIEADRMPAPPGPGNYTGGRWYPTAVTLPSGDVLAMSGHPDAGDDRHNNNTPGVFHANIGKGGQWHVFPLPNPAFELGEQESVPGTHDAAHADRSDREYPRAHLIPGGAVFCSTPLAPRIAPAATQMQIIDPTTGARAFVGLAPAVPVLPGIPALAGAEPTYNEYFGTSVMLPLLPELNFRARILLFGGERAWLVDLADVTAALRHGSVNWNRTALGTLANASPAPVRTLVGRHGRAPLRRHGNAVILPTGEVLFIGGIDSEFIPPGNPDQDRWAVLDAEVFGPANRGDLAHDSWVWRNVSAAESGTEVVPRNYHSVALLMPDGRVWSAGSSKDHGDVHEPRMQLFEPWYIAEPRPVITRSPYIMHYQRSFIMEVSHDRPIQRLALLRCGSVTHGFNSDQRYVGLAFQAVGSGLVGTAPPGGDVAPPGMYLLFALDDRGIPSEARFISLQWMPIGASHASSSGFAVSPAAGFVEVFWVRSDGMVFTNARDPNLNGGNWNNPVPIAPNRRSADPNSGVAAVSPAPRTVEVFWVGPDGMVFTNARTPHLNGGRWNNPIPIAPNPGSADPRSAVAAVCPAEGIVEVFWIRPDGMVFTNARDPHINGGNWNNPIPIAPNPGSADPRGGIVAVSPAPGIVEVFWIRPDGMVFTNARHPSLNGGRWNNPIPIAPNPGSADPRSGIAAVSPGPGIVEVFWIRPDGMVFTNARDPGINGGRWNNPIPIAPNPGSADPRSGVAAVSPVAGIVEVFWIRPDGMVFTNARQPNLNGGNWNNPIPIAPAIGSADPRSPVAAVCPAFGIVEVFWVRSDGMVFTNARDPGFNGGNWNNPIPIAPNPGSAVIHNV